MYFKGKRPNFRGSFTQVYAAGIEWKKVRRETHLNRPGKIWVANDSVNPSFWVIHHTKTQDHWSKIGQRSVDLCGPIDRTVDCNFNRLTRQRDGWGFLIHVGWVKNCHGFARRVNKTPKTLKVEGQSTTIGAKPIFEGRGKDQLYGKISWCGVPSLCHECEGQWTRAERK